MSQVAIPLPRTDSPALTPVVGARPMPETSREVMVLGAILAVIQLLDGYLTGVGVYHFGTEVEGNILLRTLMESFGLIPTLISTKALALGIIAGLCLMAYRVRWLKAAFKGIIALYLVAAIIPWCWIVAVHIY